MGMSTHVVGFKPPDEIWKKMKAVYDACDAAGVDPPVEVTRFFGGDLPDAHGVTVGRDALTKIGAVRKWQGDTSEGYEIIVDKLPPDVKIVRIYNSW